jgi:predicted DNA-binding transcriptional regulator AlpA
MKTIPIPRAVAWPNTLVLAWLRRRVTAGGGDPSAIPDEPIALWRLPTVLERTGIARSTLYRMARQGSFPKPVSLTEST